MSAPAPTVSRMWDPQRTADQYGVNVHVVRLPDGLAGCTDGTRVWVDDRLTLTERRCTLAHELVHVWAGHTGHQGPKVEAWVRRTTARLLLRDQDVTSVLRTEPTLWDAAERLGVTVPVLTDHLQGEPPWNSSSASSSSA